MTRKKAGTCFDKLSMNGSEIKSLLFPFVLSLSKDSEGTIRD